MTRPPAILVLVGVLLSCENPSDGALTRRVVFISMDTTRADHFGFLGNQNVGTPRLDALARESIVFTDYMTVAPTTLASHTSLFSGKHPHHHGSPRNGFVVHEANEMLPEILRAAGFHTAGFAGSFALAARFGFAQGFEHYDESFDVPVGPGGVDQNQRSAAALTDTVLGYLDASVIPERLFLFAHYFDPHRPYAAPEPFDTRYDPRGRDGLPSIPELLQGRSRSNEWVEHVRRQTYQYAAEISYMDGEIGRLLDGLAQRGILDEALIVITSDHGESFWEHGENFDHGLTVYQPTVRGVCMIRLPTAGRGGKLDPRPVSTIDVLPTVLDFMRLPIPAGVEGQALLSARVSPTRLRFGQATKPWEHVETDPRWNNLTKARFVREDRYKLIQTPYLGTEELYDLVADPGERHNLLDDPDVETGSLAARLGGELTVWAHSARPLVSEFESTYRQETIDRLRTLGYLH